MARRNKKNSERQLGILEIVCALIVVMAVAASAVWELKLNLIIVLAMLVAAYAVLRDLGILWRLKKPSQEIDTVTNCIKGGHESNMQFLHGEQQRVTSPGGSSTPMSSNHR